MNTLNVNKMIKSTLKVKGNIAINMNTKTNLDKLEKKGVDIALLVASLLDELDYKSLLNSIDNSEESSEIS